MLIALFDWIVRLTTATTPAFFLEHLEDSREYSDLFIRAHIAAAAIGGEIVVAEVPGKGIVGVAVWCAPCYGGVFRLLTVFRFGPGQGFLATYAPIPSAVVFNL